MTSVSDTWQRSIVRKGLGVSKHKFKSLDSLTTYNWKYSAGWNDGMTLRIKKTGVVVATLTRITSAPREKGRLVVSPVSCFDFCFSSLLISNYPLFRILKQINF